MQNWQLNQIDQKLLDLALQEDLCQDIYPPSSTLNPQSFTDITTDTLFPKNINRSVKITSKDKKPIVVCGLPVIDALLAKFNSKFAILTNFKDGDVLQPGETLLTINCDANTLLKTERTLLNFLRHLCAIATLTKKFVSLIKDTNTKILDTRKTSPGMRHLEKYAVHCGGGVNHRFGLYDAFMLKDTHIDLLGGMKNAIAKLPDKNKLPVIVEIRNLAELEVVLQFGKNKIDRVLLDNMSTELLKVCVQKCQGIFQTEASGNITLATIEEIAKTGVDFASVGQLTYAAGQVDLSMLGC
jgi:nicotinate-nucleotide pyrophosphorylase (carboxylating)